MSENKRYYWLKLDENFFEDDTIAWLEEQENGKDYVIFYLKLALKSLKDDGRLIRYVGETLIPYDVRALAKLTNTSPDTVAVSMKTFLEIGLVSQLESGEIYLNQIEEMVGSETDVAKRVRKHRAKKALGGCEKKELLQGNTSETKSNTEIEKERELEKESDIDIDKEKNKPANKLADSELQQRFDNLWEQYPNKKSKPKAFTAYKKAIKEGTTDDEILKGIENYKQEIEIKRTDKQYIAHASTWFNQKRWLDEYDLTSNRTEYDANAKIDEELGF